MAADENMEEADIGGLSEDVREFFRSFPDGYRFMPNDEELVVEYLKKEVNNQPLPMNKIRRIDIYQHHPQQLCQRDEEHREKEWYFFSTRYRKYPKGNRPKRQAAGGFWKPTGADKSVFHKGRVVGYKKSLDFYEGQHQCNPKRTDWKMHEYRILHHPQPVSNNKDTAPPNTALDIVLCKMYRKTNAKKENNNNINGDDEAGGHQAIAAANDNGADDHQNSHHFNNEQQQPQPQQLQRVAEPPYDSGGGAVVQSMVTDMPTQPQLQQQQQLQRVAEPPYDSGGGAVVQSMVTDIPTLSTTDNFVIHENDGQGDGSLMMMMMMNSVEGGAGEDFYYPPNFRSDRSSFHGFDELSAMFDQAHGPRHGDDKKP